MKSSDNHIASEMSVIKESLWQPFIETTRHPRAAQEKVLLEIIHQNTESRYGREHNFSDIKNYEGFVENVPVQNYEDLRRYVEQGELTVEQPVLYARTSGSTGAPKLIPILESTREQYRQSQHIAAFRQYDSIPGIYDGKVLAIVSPEREGEHQMGIPYGSMSGIISKSMPDSIQSRYVIPDVVLGLDDYEQKYFLVAAFALAEKDLTFFASANPSTFLKLAEVISHKYRELVSAIENGCEGVGNEPLPPNPERAEELKSLAPRDGAVSFEALWPNLRAITTWTSGSCSVLIPRLRRLLSAQTKIVEMGYLASEFRGSITVDALRNIAVPTLHENFFEFVERSEWEANTPTYRRLDELEEGTEYYVIVTTHAGLFRYSIDDIVKATGKFHETPTIEFVQKGKNITNITGEKLYEIQVVDAIGKVEKEHNLAIDFFVMLAVPERMLYQLFVEHHSIPDFDLSKSLDRQLMRTNIEYREKRNSDRLKPLEVLIIKPGTGEAYKKHCINRTQRESQHKIAHLQYKGEQTFDFESYVC
jgi:hypothetical protein